MMNRQSSQISTLISLYIIFIYYQQPTPEYKPIEKGIDVATQIGSFEPELFDYILEVEAVLQVIVGKTMQEARMELIEEDEFLAL